MATTLQFALSNPIAGIEDEFNRWYGTEHLEHGVATPGILAGQRFKRVIGPWPSGQHDYLMIWKMDDPAFALGELAKTRDDHRMQVSPSIDMTTVQPPTMWRRATVGSNAPVPVNTATRKTVVLGLYTAAEGEEAAFTQALLNGRLAEHTDLSGVISAAYLTLADEQIRSNVRKFPHGVLIELHEKRAGVAALDDALASLPHANRKRWAAIVFGPLGKRMTTQVIEGARIAHD